MICSFLRRLEAGIQYNQLRMRWWTWQFLIIDLLTAWLKSIKN